MLPYQEMRPFEHDPEQEHFKRSTLAKVVGCLAFSALAISGIFGNSLVIYTISVDPAVQVKTNLSNLPILNLAYTDLMTTGMVCIPGAVFILCDEYSGGRIFCLIWSLTNLLGFITTMGLLAVISVDRFIFDYDFWGGVCDITWISMGPDNPPAFLYGVFCTLWFFVMPSSIILVANLLIIQNSKEKRHAGKLQHNKETKTEAKANSKILKAMIIVIASYFVLTFPSGCVKVSKVLGGEKGPARFIPGWFTTTTSLLQLSASIVNPLIYGLFRKDFRQSYARTWKKVRG
ncbi:uncharacterized protein LOC110849937 [Folsomia candida]|uniref:uncharacterized protein LOC110849937 n=1 Tax=Folsomia candida TaxID=158441 RepID=UPI000B8F8C81|nr:uncharacterized protein LOC110849937 [Folsomia candida]